MFLSKRSNGIYYLWFNTEGAKKQKISTGCNLKTDALKFLRDFKEGEKKRTAEVKRKTLSSFHSDYQTYSKTVHTLKTQHSIDNAFNELIRITRDIRLDHLGVREIEAFLAQKKAEASDWTARKYYIHIASAFETAKRWNYISDNPFRKVQKPKTRELQPVFFSKAEVHSLLKVIHDEQYKSLCLVGLFTGMRLGEIINLQWSDVDMITKVVHVRNSESFTTKTKRNRSIPMNEELFHLFCGISEMRSSELVFHSKAKRLNGETISRCFKPLVLKAGINTRLHFHSLRHTFATWLVQEGVSLYEVQKLLGHSNISVTQIYAHLQPEGLHNTVNKISLQLN